MNLSSKNSNTFIKDVKDDFNNFFQNNLYGYFDNPENIILSRGTWNDEFIKYPDIFKFCIDKSLNNKWCGYSDSLGHDNVFSELEKYVKLTNKNYSKDNLALTLGNVAGLNIIFQHLKKDLIKNKKELSLVSIKPFYPSILDSISSLNGYDVTFVDGYRKNEKNIISDFQDIIDINNIGAILLPNLIGVDGRTYSKNFFNEIIKLCDSFDIKLIIDETIWFNKFDYPDNIISDNVIRLVSLSKMFSIPGMKLGFLVGSKNFIKDFYNTASSSYGGPASIFFLLQEFIYIFEKNRLENNYYLPEEVKKNLFDRYSFNSLEMDNLYKNYLETIEFNYNNFIKNLSIVKNWSLLNKNLFDYISLNLDNPAINTIFEKNGIDFNNFLVSLLEIHKTSIFPGNCIGLDKNTFRLNFLEKSDDLEKGLNNISDLLRNYKMRIRDKINIIIFDSKKIINLDDFIINKIFNILNLKKIDSFILGNYNDINYIRNIVNINVNSIILEGNNSSEKINIIKNILLDRNLNDENLIYFRENSFTCGVNNSILDFLLLEL